jgi:hypothetical protein
MYAINPATGNFDDNYWANVVEPRLKGSSSSSGVSSVTDLAKQMYELANQFRQPAINTLESSRAGIGTAYSGLTAAAQAQQPLVEQNYQNLLKDVTQTTRNAAANEFSQRGIPLSSGLVEQTVGTRLAPQIANVGQQRATSLQGIQDLIANLGMGQQSAYSNLDSAIAAIQAASAPEAISSAQNIYSQQQQAQQAAATLALQKLIAEQNAAKTASANQYQTLGEGQTLYDLLNNQAVYTAPKTYAPKNTYGIIPFPDM